jgi:hypothetical protein
MHMSGMAVKTQALGFGKELSEVLKFDSLD